LGIRRVSFRYFAPRNGLRVAGAAGGFAEGGAEGGAEVALAAELVTGYDQAVNDRR
jgi:hypothetical protein